jgi:trans-aconitate 2-methyltransferase
MSEAVENLIVDFVEWVGRRERTYSEALETWRTSCPKLPIWEDANDRGLVETAFVDGRLLVRVTQAGLAMLRERRPQSLPHLR